MLAFPLRRLTTWCVIGAYCLVASGLPLPLGGSPAAVDAAASRRLAGKDRSTPFPCMDKPCGCATAEQCFSKCCCNTPAELLVWAKANRVEPGLIAALTRGAAAEKPAVSSCCAAKEQPSCCTELPVEAPRQPADLADEPVSRHTVVLSSMLACGGLVSQWLAIGGSLPPLKVEAARPLPPLVDRIVLADDHPGSVLHAPDAPPPRA